MSQLVQAVQIGDCNVGFKLSIAIPTARHGLRGALAILCLGALAPVLAAPPTPGAIQQQTTPPPTLPSAPGPVLTLPEPVQQGGQSAVRIAVREIRLEGNQLIPTAELMPLVAEPQAKTVTLGELNQAAGRVTAYYRAQGYPLAYAYLPAQTIADGTVRIAVVEPRYDEVSLKGDSRLKAEQAARTLGLDSGAPIEQAPLERGLLLLNQTPGVRVAGTLVPGAKPGTSSLDVRVSDTPRVRGALTVDNEGSEATGRIRGLAEVSFDNPFGYGGQIAGSGLTTESGLLRAGTLNLRSPDLYQGLRASLYGSQTEYTLGGDFASLNLEGQASQWGLGLDYPLILQPGRLLSARLDALRNRFRQQSTTGGLDDRSHIDLLRLSLNGAVANAAGGMTSGGISVGRGTLGLDSTDARVADAAGPNAAGDFWVGQIDLQQDQPLPGAFRLQVNLSGQVASHNLDDSQKFYLTGPDGVMSYPVGAVGGDAGALLRLKLARGVPLELPGRLEAALLGQYGEVWFDHSRYPGATDPNHTDLAAVGFGLDYRWSRLAAQLDYARRVGSAPVGTDSNDNDQLWARLRLDF